MRFLPPLFAALLIVFLQSITGCTPHSDPMAGWQLLGIFSRTAVPEPIKQDAQAYFQTLPKVDRDNSEDNLEVIYSEDGTGQHAVILRSPHNGEYWHYALIYDRNNRRIKVLKYSTGSYGITDARIFKCSDGLYIS